jgi:NADPH:quinone reductase
MKAIVVEKTGKPEVLLIKNVPVPKLKEGWVLIKNKAFGLNRSELFTRQGHSPDVEFPRILGIECAGIIDESSVEHLQKGQQVASIMGGMGRQFDGSYAEYTLVPSDQVFPFQSDLDWATLGAIPEMFQTVWGSLYKALKIEKGEVLLIRGGTSSIGMTATQLAKYAGLKVIATTRNEKKEKALLDNGADKVIIDSGQISSRVREEFPEGVDKVLELVGTKTLIDSLQTVKKGGTLCVSGILGNEWEMKHFAPMTDIPSTVRLTAYSGDKQDLSAHLLQKFIKLVEMGEVKIKVDKVFQMSQITEAHQYMEDNKASGKLVVKLD